MVRVNKVQRQLRRLPLIRKLLLIDAKHTRKILQQSTWEYRLSVLSGVGLLVSTYSGIERQLDTLIAHYHRHRIADLEGSKLPTYVSQKAPYLRKMVLDQRLPLNLREHLPKWADELCALADHRNLIIHGNMHHQSPYRMEWEVQKLKLKGHEPTFEIHRFSNDELNAWNQRAGVFHHHIASILTPILFPNWHGGFEISLPQD